MKRNTALKILNPILGVLVLNQVLTGLFAEDISHEVFEVLHGGGGVVFAIGVVLHLILNWNWVRASFLKKSVGGEAGSKA